MKQIIFIFNLFLISTQVLSADTCSISGKVIDPIKDSSHFQVYGASVSVVGTDIGSLVDFEGNFCIKGLSSGTYKLKVTHLSYVTKVVEFNLSDSSLVKLEIPLERKIDPFSPRVVPPFPNQPDILEKFRVDYGTYQGYVFDSSVNATLSGAAIIFKSKDKEYGTYSKVGGYFEIKLPPGKYEVSVFYINSYLECEFKKNYEIVIKTGEIIKKDFNLHCQPNLPDLLTE